MGRVAEPVSKRVLVQKSEMKGSLAKSDVSCSKRHATPLKRKPRMILSGVPSRGCLWMCVSHSPWLMSRAISIAMSPAHSM